jgi:hypothetical protein
MDKPINLHMESLMLEGARKMLYQLREHYKIGAKLKSKSREDDLYAQAEIDMILSSMDNVKNFLTYGAGNNIRYYDHKRDKNGKLVSVKARFSL